MLERGRLGVVLPSTESQGAWKVATHVCAAIDMVPQDMNCEIYEYPDYGLFEQTGGDRNEQLQQQSDKKVAVRSLVELFCRPLPLWKRGLDIIGATTGLILLAPLFFVMALVIKLTSKGPVIFVQWRSGLLGRPFRMFKFRTMCVDAEALMTELRPWNEVEGPVFKIKKDPRVTFLGRFLRVSSIDELPQLINVLKGEMSLVGPRPLPCNESSQFNNWQSRRLESTPGLTCIWQVSGRSNVGFHDWVRMDIQYIRRQSLKTDLSLIAQTVPAVLLRKGAH
ncbi:MAG: sugar transferase [Pirellulales bacterium]